MRPAKSETIPSANVSDCAGDRSYARIAARDRNGDYSTTMLNAWLNSRVPTPPERLARRLELVLAASADPAPGTIAERLTMAAFAILTQLGHDEASRPGLSGPGGHVSDAALDLLAADALVTYAAEAAADECNSFAATTDAMIARLASIRISGRRPV